MIHAGGPDRRVEPALAVQGEVDVVVERDRTQAADPFPDEV
jgi:hypothetical protein